MFKAILKIFVLFTLIVFNVALLIWGINQLELNKTIETKIPVVNQQAKVNHKTPRIQKIEVVAHNSIQNDSFSVDSQMKMGNDSKKHLVLQFQPVEIELDKTETVKLENLLDNLDVNPSYSAKIFFGVALSEKNVPFPQMAKIRAQTIARMIYPYTQTVKMYYRPSMANNKVIVEVSEPPK
jgi:uncharacterized membrane-anchored protein YitT (DUF2179 family)